MDRESYNSGYLDALESATRVAKRYEDKYREEPKSSEMAEKIGTQLSNMSSEYRRGLEALKNSPKSCPSSSAV